MSKIDETRLEQATAIATYPASKQTLIHQVQAGGIDEEIMSFIEDLPDRSYHSSEEVIHAIREIEASRQTDVWRTPGSHMG